MTTRDQIAFWMYLLLMVSLAAWGASFLLRGEFTAYHAVAVGVPWDEVPVNFQILILALLKLSGALWLACASCLTVMLLIPFRRGLCWARWAVPILLITLYAAPIPAMTLVTRTTEATPPWLFTILAIFVALIAMAISLSGRPRSG